jgi:hypothetical protein
VAIALSLAVSAASAGELPLSETPGVAPADFAALDFAALVEQLDSVEFGERQAASEQLHDAGLAALESLEQAALRGSREASVRAFAVFKEHYTAGDRELQQAVYDVLQRLASSAPASVAQRARNILNPPKPEAIAMSVPNGPQNFGPPGGIGGNFGNRGGNFNRGGGFARGGNFGNANPPFAPPNLPAPNGVRRMSLSIINGRRILELDERERRIKLSTDGIGAISAEITETQNGRNVTRAIEAKDLDELKRKDAELARLYEQYNRPGPGPVGAIGPAAPFGFIPPPPPPRNPADVARQQRDLLDRLIQQQKRRLPNDPNAQRMIDALEQTRQRLPAAPAGG